MSIATDPDARAAQLANIGPDSSLKHGVRAADGCLMRCDKCPVRDRCEAMEPGGTCALEAEYVRDRRAAIRELPFIDPILDGPALSILVWQELRIIRAARYLSAFGELLPGAESGYLEAQPLSQKLSTLVNSWQRHLQNMGLTPPERKRLTSTGEAGPAAAIAEAIRKLSREERDEACIDADFEASDEEGGSDDE